MQARRYLLTALMPDSQSTGTAVIIQLHEEVIVDKESLSEEHENYFRSQYGFTKTDK